MEEQKLADPIIFMATIGCLCRGDVRDAIKDIIRRANKCAGHELVELIEQKSFLSSLFLVEATTLDTSNEDVDTLYKLQDDLNSYMAYIQS